jgi:mannose-6-phosphate isomerase-like protein (cupin superfamily)
MDSIEAEVDRARNHGTPYREFLRVPTLSSGVYVLPVGGTDRQSPHGEDEVYYVVRGRARFSQGTAERAVQTGDLLFVPAREPHRFHSVLEELVLLVVFAPPESLSAP